MLSQVQYLQRSSQILSECHRVTIGNILSSFHSQGLTFVIHFIYIARMHAAGNFRPCSIEGQWSLEPMIMDKFLWDTHSSTHFWDFTEALPPPPPLPTQSMLGINWSTLSHTHYFSLHFPQETLNWGGGKEKNPECAISELKDKMLNCSEEFVHNCS